MQMGLGKEGDSRGKGVWGGRGSPFQGRDFGCRQIMPHAMLEPGMLFASLKKTPHLLLARRVANSVISLFILPARQKKLNKSVFSAGIWDCCEGSGSV